MLVKQTALRLSTVCSATTCVRGFSQSSASHSESVETSSDKTSSLQIKNPRMRTAILEGYTQFGGPPSLKSRTARARYTTPIGLDKAFPLAFDIIKDFQKSQYNKADSLKSELEKAVSNDTDAEQVGLLKAELEKTLIEAELDSPEVQYNFEIGQVDYREPVYRYLAEKKWREYDMLILIQRLETLKVIPDTMPTLNPKAHVELQFPGFVNKWVVPGTVLPCAVATRPPLVKIQEFEEIADNSLYTLVIVDPDTPDLVNDSYTTSLQWAISNIPLSNVESVVDAEKATELIPYLPPTPEKNTGNHRYAVWAFRQTNGAIDSQTAQPLVKREGFDIRAFSDELGLEAVGAHIWRSKYDRTTDELREKYGLKAGRVFTRVRR